MVRRELEPQLVDGTGLAESGRSAVGNVRAMRVRSRRAGRQDMYRRGRRGQPHSFMRSNHPRRVSGSVGKSGETRPGRRGGEVDRLHQKGTRRRRSRARRARTRARRRGMGTASPPTAAPTRGRVGRSPVHGRAAGEEGRRSGRDHARLCPSRRMYRSLHLASAVGARRHVQELHRPLGVEGPQVAEVTRRRGARSSSEGRGALSQALKSRSSRTRAMTEEDDPRCHAARTKMRSARAG